MHRRAIPGTGVDCIHLVVEALIAAGLVDRFVVPPYRRTEGFMAKKNRMEEMFLEIFFAEKLDPGTTPLLDGDVVVFTIDRSINHVGIFLGSEIWHASAIHDTIHEPPAALEPSRIQSVLRFTESGFRLEPSEWGRFTPVRKHR